MLALRNQPFLLVSGEYADTCYQGPFVAHRDLPAAETAMAFAEWLAAFPAGERRARARALIEAADLTDGFAAARDGDPSYDEMSAAFAAWLVTTEAASPAGAPIVRVEVYQRGDGSMGMGLRGGGLDVPDLKAGTPEFPAPLGAFGR